MQALMKHGPTPRPDCTGLGVGLGSYTTRPCPPRGSLASQTGLELKVAREEVRSPLEFRGRGGCGQVAQVAQTAIGRFGAMNQDGSVFQDEPGGGRKEDPTCELEPRSLHLGSVFLEMGAASLLRGHLEAATLGAGKSCGLAAGSSAGQKWPSERVETGPCACREPA